MRRSGSVWPEKDVRRHVAAGDARRVSGLATRTRRSRPTTSISIMVGDLQRIRMYPAKGFQIPQDIPDDVWQAYRELVEAGYDSRLVDETAAT